MLLQKKGKETTACQPQSDTPRKVEQRGRQVLRRIVRKSRQRSADSVTAAFQTSSGINIMYFHSRAVPVGVMCGWPSTFVHIVYSLYMFEIHMLF